MERNERLGTDLKMNLSRRERVDELCLDGVIFENRRARWVSLRVSCLVSDEGHLVPEKLGRTSHLYDQIKEGKTILVQGKGRGEGREGPHDHERTETAQTALVDG